MTRLKICGITTLADARYCAGAGVDYLGFIQHPESPRYVAPETAAEIIAWLYGPEPVGVFVNTAPDAINTVAAQTGFGTIQLSGNETVEDCRLIDRPVIKALHVRPDTSPDDLRRSMDAYLPHVAAFLLDTARAGLWGGTGQAFDWDVAAELSQAYPLFVAGGLHAGNIGEVVTRVRPYGVDLASGVESAPGIKDIDKLAALFEAFEAVASSSSSN